MKRDMELTRMPLLHIERDEPAPDIALYIEAGLLIRHAAA